MIAEHSLEDMFCKTCSVIYCSDSSLTVLLRTNKDIISLCGMQFAVQSVQAMPLSGRNSAMARYIWIVMAWSPRDGGWVYVLGSFRNKQLAFEAVYRFMPLLLPQGYPVIAVFPRIAFRAPRGIGLYSDIVIERVQQAAEWPDRLPSGVSGALHWIELRPQQG